MSWRDDLDHSLARVKQSIEEDFARVRDTAKGEGARSAAEVLNQAIRRMRQASDSTEVLALLADASSPFTKRAAAIVLDDVRARVSHVRGFIASEVQFPVTSAAAMLAAIETKDPVVAAANDAEFSSELCAVALRDIETVERGYLFPLVCTGSVKAMLFAVGGVEAASLELLSEAAAMRLEVLDAKPKPASAVADSKAARAWTDLSPADQALHLKAQRFARVKVAEMRLARPAAVREGQERTTLYRTLRPEIDAARETFRKDFVAQAPHMVDYLYIELVRSLANDDDKLLGPDFPGRLI